MARSNLDALAKGEERGCGPTVNWLCNAALSMPVPESQLSTWSTQGAITSAAATYESIRRALTPATAPQTVRGADIYLQGSYKNNTNVRGDSDVDIVVQLNGTIHSNVSRLSALDRARYDADFTQANYAWADFRRDVLTQLRAAFGAQSVVERNKCVAARAPIAGRGAGKLRFA